MRTGPIDPSRLSQTEDVYDRLRTAILNGQYPPDQKLKINELCRETGASIGTVREALSRLLSEGLVVSESYKGFHVAPVSLPDLISLTKARIEIEKLCLASSLGHGDIAWEGRLVSLAHQLSRYSPHDTALDAWSRLHTTFHDALVSACDNAWLLRMHRILHEQSERYRRLVSMFNASLDSPTQRQREGDMQTEHKELAEAAIARDIDRACELIAVHLRRTTDYLVGQLQELPALVERTKRAGTSSGELREDHPR
jgi:GntR family carbon starvation induced transcriptional regulator